MKIGLFALGIGAGTYPDVVRAASESAERLGCDLVTNRGALVVRLRALLSGAAARRPGPRTHRLCFFAPPG